MFFNEFFFKLCYELNLVLWKIGCTNVRNLTYILRALGESDVHTSSKC